MRLALFLTTALMALLLAVLSLQSPRPLDADAPSTAFSTARAMADIREIAQQPHPTGTDENLRVRQYLYQRMEALDLQPIIQEGVLSPRAVQRLESWGIDSFGLHLFNLVGVLPGTDPDLPPILIMAHYDTVPGSPGAADDSTGVAAILETVRALKARAEDQGPAPRDLIVLLTDAEELNLDGARTFFTEHPQRARIGAVINLEARGGGGRAVMFETGRRNAGTIDLFADTVGRVDGGVTSNALGVYVYGLMPNGTDFSLARERGLPGLNFAFIGRPDHYHTPVSTPETLDQGSVQHIGSQALEAADAMIRSTDGPALGTDRVYADILGRFIISHSPQFGWIVLLAAAGLAALAFWRLRRRSEQSPVPLPQGLARIGFGAVDGLWFVTLTMLATQAVRVFAGPLAERQNDAATYYTLLKRLPVIEAGAVLACLAVALLFIAGRAAVERRRMAAFVVALLAIALIGGGFDWIILITGLIALAISLFVRPLAQEPQSLALGLIGAVLLLGLGLQIVAPQTAFLYLWTGLLASGALAASAFIRPRHDHDWRPLVVPALAAVIGIGWLGVMAHLVFLGVGMDRPSVLALIALPALALLTPLSPPMKDRRILVLAALVVLLIAGGVSAAAQRVQAPPATEVVG